MKTKDLNIPVIVDVDGTMKNVVIPWKVIEDHYNKMKTDDKKEESIIKVPKEIYSKLAEVLCAYCLLKHGKPLAFYVLPMAEDLLDYLNKQARETK